MPERFIFLGACACSVWLLVLVFGYLVALAFGFFGILWFLVLVFFCILWFLLLVFVCCGSCFWFLYLMVLFFLFFPLPFTLY